MTIRKSKTKAIYTIYNIYNIIQARHPKPCDLFKSLPVEVNNSTIELHLPVDSQYSLPVETLNLIVKSKSIKPFFI